MKLLIAMKNRKRKTFFLNFISKEAEKSLLYFRSIRKYSKHTKQQISEDLQKLHFGSSDEDGKLSFDDFSMYF
jgi:hypothetical protein